MRARVSEGEYVIITVWGLEATKCLEHFERLNMFLACVCVGRYRVCGYLRRPEYVILSSATEVTGSCEPPKVGTEKNNECS